jgi:flagellar basal-body rod protein FlgG
MIRAMWTAASAMAAQQLNMDVLSHNLANSNTVGFKRSRADFQDMLYQELRSPGAAASAATQLPTGIQLGTGVRAVAVSKIFTSGSLQQTQNELDLAIEGDGFFQISRPDGTIAYTRSGAFKKNSTGQVVTSDGDPILPNITVPQNTLRLTIGSDGTVSVLAAGSTNTSQIGALQLARFDNPSGLSAIGSNLFLPSDSSGDATTGNPGTPGFGTLAQGFVESSNVNIAEEMVNMIIGQRNYEINAKAVQTSDEMLQTANGLKR